MTVTLPSFDRLSSPLRATTNDSLNPNCPIKIAHGTTTLLLRFMGRVIVATDLKDTVGKRIALQMLKKVIEINFIQLRVMAEGGAADDPDVLLAPRIC